MNVVISQVPQRPRWLTGVWVFPRQSIFNHYPYAVAGPVICIVTMLLYALSAAIGLHFVLKPEGITPVWPASGVAVAILALVPARYWPCVVVGMLLAQIPANLRVGRPILEVSLFCAANTAEVLVGGMILTRFGRDEVRFRSIAQLIRLFIVVAPANALIAWLLALPVVHFQYATDLWHFWRLWAVSDGLGILVMTPLLLSFRPSDYRKLPPMRVLEISLILSLSILVATSLLHAMAIPLMFDLPVVFTIPLLLWAALRADVAMTAMVTLIFATCAVLGTVSGQGIFAQSHTPVQFVLVPLQVTIIAWAACGLAISVSMAQCQETLSTLRQREDRFRLLASGSPAAVFQTDSQGRCTYINQRWEEITGQAVEDALGSGWARAIHPEDTERVRETWGRAVAGMTSFFSEHRVLRPSGEVRWIAVRLTALPPANGVQQGHVGVGIDITPRKLQEAEEEARRRFHALVADLSVRLVDADADHVDQAVREGLVALAGMLELDRVSLSERSEDGQRLHIIFSHVTGGPQFSPYMRMDTLHPWTWQRLLACEVVMFEHIDQTPAEATVDRASWRERNIKSLVLVPVSIGGMWQFVLSVGTTQCERAWPEELVRRLRVLGETFAHALVRSRIEQELRERLRFGTVVTEISGLLVNASAADLDDAIQKSLRMLADVIDVDRVTLSERSPDGALVRVVNSFTREGVAIPADARTDLMHPWLWKKLARGESFACGSLDEIPPDAIVDRESFVARGTKSFVVIPVSVGGVIRFAFSVATVRAERTWSEDSARRLRVLGETLANAINRADSDRELHASEASLRQLNIELSRAEDRERRRLAALLHDDIAQSIFASIAQLVSMRGSAGLAQPVDAVISMLDRTLRQSRELTYQLCPPALYELGLAAALERLAEQIQQQHGLVCRLKTGESVRRLEPELASFLYQATRELLLNVVKHAKATQAWIEILQGEDDLQISVIDDGVGISPQRASPSSSGFGLHNIRERLRAMGGSFSIGPDLAVGREHGTGHGSCARLSIPSTAVAAAAKE